MVAGITAVLCYRTALVCRGSNKGTAVLPRIFPSAQSGTLWHKPVPALSTYLVLPSSFLDGNNSLDHLYCHCNRERNTRRSEAHPREIRRHEYRLAARYSCHLGAGSSVDFQRFALHTSGIYPPTYSSSSDTCCRLAASSRSRS